MAANLMRTGTFYLRSRGYATIFNPALSPDRFGLGAGEVLTMTASPNGSDAQFEYLATGASYTYQAATGGEYGGPAEPGVTVTPAFGNNGAVAIWGVNVSGTDVTATYSLLDDGLNYHTTPALPVGSGTVSFIPQLIKYNGTVYYSTAYDPTTSKFACLDSGVLRLTELPITGEFIPVTWFNPGTQRLLSIISPVYKTDNFTINYCWYFGNFLMGYGGKASIWPFSLTGALLPSIAVTLSDNGDNALLQQMTANSYTETCRAPFITRGAPYTPNAGWLMMMGYYDGGAGILEGATLFVIGADGSWYERYTIAAAPDDALAVATLGDVTSLQALDDASFRLQYAPTAGAGAGPQLYFMRSTTVPGMLLSAYLEAETVLPLVNPLPLECVPCASVLFDPP